MENNKVSSDINAEPLIDNEFAADNVNSEPLAESDVIWEDFSEVELGEQPLEYEPKNKYEKLLYRVYKDETLSEIFRISSYVVVALTVYAFFVRLVSLIETPIEILKILVITGVPFVVVSVMRKIINAPRPYELLEFYEKKPKGKAGQSFPSRHVFSVFVIATVFFAWEPIIAAGLILAGVLLAFLRVALGIHFVRDVIAGALIGIASGSVGLLILHFL